MAFLAPEDIERTTALCATLVEQAEADPVFYTALMSATLVLLRAEAQAAEDPRAEIEERIAAFAETCRQGFDAAPADPHRLVPL